MDLEPTLSHAIADGWAEFTERVLPAIQDAEHAEARVAFYFGALYVLQLAQQVIADRSSGSVRNFVCEPDDKFTRSTQSDLRTG
jgi:hypothetical protein